MSVRASQAGIDAIRQAMKRNNWTQVEVAKEVGFSRSTLNQILSGQAVKLENIEELCHLFDLQVGQVVEPEDLGNLSNLDSLVQEIRDRIHPIIQERCGTMRVLDMPQPIGLDKIYTHVNILEKITGSNRRELAELLPEVSPEKFERFSLGDVKKERVPGLEAVETHSKLMILGKPGAGKTTFLKHLAMQCLGGKFQANRVPIFITLKAFAETEGQPDLLTYIETLVHPKSSPNVQSILESGRALILLDGLDEVRETDANRVLNQIQQFSERNASNAFVITCRIAAREYTFEKFTEVEVADFDDAQIADVSDKWFGCKQDEVKAKRFLEKLKENPPIRELASSPLLLTLLCLVFEDSGDFPANRSELYKDGVDVLLKKWDGKRNIERDQVYKKLSLKRKEDLLSQIAFSTFVTGNYFFKQKDLERQIREFIENLPGASTDEETLNLDSEAVLKSIEAQHGLFVERARSIYSFSHLTFHEYFAAREIKEKSYFKVLSKHLTDKRWREVTLLTVGMLPNADVCLRQMKQAVDGLLAGDRYLQSFLTWVQQEASTVESSYSSQAIRACCIKDDISLSLKLDKNLSTDYQFAVKLIDSIAVGLIDSIAFDLGHDFDDYQSNKERIIVEQIKEYIRFAIARSIIFYPDIRYGLQRLNNLSLLTDFSLLADWNEGEFFSQDCENSSEQTWEEILETWRQELCNVISEYENYIHDWEFEDEQSWRLHQYYDANKLLVDCLNSDCYISRSVREEIEATLLLPIAAIKQNCL